MNLNGNLTVRRTIGAPAHDVFAAWTKAELMTLWGVDGFTADARPGGHYRQVTRDDTDEHVVSGEYREFVPDEGSLWRGSTRVRIRTAGPRRWGP